VLVVVLAVVLVVVLVVVVVVALAVVLLVVVVVVVVLVVVILVVVLLLLLVAVVVVVVVLSYIFSFKLIFKSNIIFCENTGWPLTKQDLFDQKAAYKGKEAILGAFEKLRKAATSFVMPVCPPARNSAPTLLIFMKFYI
jgi:hypothetical protein